jgi:hypothetical protein
MEAAVRKVSESTSNSRLSIKEDNNAMSDARVAGVLAITVDISVANQQGSILRDIVRTVHLVGYTNNRTITITIIMLWDIIRNVHRDLHIAHPAVGTLVVLRIT